MTRFIADAHLGGLARFLRMLGFDTLYDNRYADDEIRRRASEERRIILTRDRALLVCRTVTHGCYVHARKPEAQLREIIERLALGGCVRPFTRCLHCNLPLTSVERKQVLNRLPPAVADRYERFTSCAGCERIYWEGSHWERMRALLQTLLPNGLGS